MLFVLIALPALLALPIPQHRAEPPPTARAAQPELEEIKSLLASGSAGEAIRRLRKILQADPAHADAHLLLGTALTLDGKVSDAMFHLREAVRLRPDSAPAHNTLGVALSRFAQLDRARAAFEKAIELAPKFSEPRVNLALVLAQLKEFDLGVTHISRAIELQGDSPAAAYSYYVRARLYLEKGAPAKAVEDSEKAVRLRPDYGEAYLVLGMARRALLDEAGATRAFESAVRFAPGDHLPRYNLGKAYMTAGKPQEALEHLRAALRLKPDDRATLYNLSRALRAAGIEDEAKPFERRMAELLREREKAAAASITATALNNEGVELEKAGNLRAALEKYRAALELDPLHAGFRLNFALALCRLGRWQEGISELKEVLRLDPNNAEATQALFIAREKAEETGK